MFCTQVLEFRPLVAYNSIESLQPLLFWQALPAHRPPSIKGISAVTFGTSCDDIEMTRLELTPPAISKSFFSYDWHAFLRISSAFPNSITVPLIKMHIQIKLLFLYQLIGDVMRPISCVKVLATTAICALLKCNM